MLDALPSLDEEVGGEVVHPLVELYQHL